MNFDGLDEAQKELIRPWVPKQGLLEVIKYLCGERKFDIGRHLFMPPPGDLTIDPQKQDMGFFRTRCRYDVLRVARNQLKRPDGNLTMSISDVLGSRLLTRIYDPKDIDRSVRYWADREFLKHLTLGGNFTVDDLSDEKIIEEEEQYDWEEATGGQSTEQTREYDLFICHASEDKDDFVRPLAKALRESGLRVWYDEFALKLGDSLRREIDAGLKQSRYGVVVLSEAFFAKEWPDYELDGLLDKEMEGKKVVLPVWHNVTKDRVSEYSPSLAAKFAANSSAGIDDIVSRIREVVKTK